MDRDTPIFFGVTRSFWFAAATAAMIADQGEAVLLPLSTLVCTPLGCDPETLMNQIVLYVPLLTLALALRERAGKARPYTMDPRAVK